MILIISYIFKIYEIIVLLDRKKKNNKNKKQINKKIKIYKNESKSMIKFFKEMKI